MLLPTASVLTLVFYFLLEVPAFLFLGFWFVFQLWQGGFSLVEPRPAASPSSRTSAASSSSHDGSAVQHASSATTRLLMEDEEFDEHVRAALDALPAEIARGLDNVAVVVEEESRRPRDSRQLLRVPAR